jgi:hypothetical protein
LEIEWFESQDTEFEKIVFFVGNNRKMKQITLYIMLLIASVGNSQMKVRSGEFENLKGISAFNVTFDYSDLQVHGFDSEKSYLDEKMQKREQKEGEAEKFEENWYTDRSNKYEPKFIEYFNKQFRDSELSVSRDSTKQYTMHVKTTWIYPGYNVVAGKEPAKISATISVFETSNPAKVLFIVDFNKSIGLEPGTFDFDQGYRIAGAYEKLARNMALQLKRFL